MNARALDIRKCVNKKVKCIFPHPGTFEATGSDKNRHNFSLITAPGKTGCKMPLDEPALKAGNGNAQLMNTQKQYGNYQGKNTNPSAFRHHRRNADFQSDVSRILNLHAGAVLSHQSNNPLIQQSSNPLIQ